MAYAVATQPVPFGALTTHRFVTSLLRGAAAVRRWNETRHTVAQLRRLSPSQLEDIGLTRADLATLTDGMF